MPVNKFGSSPRKRDYGAIISRLRPTVESLRNYVRDNALCLESSDYDARERKIRRLSEPESDTDAANKTYVERALRAIREDESKHRAESKVNESQRKHEFMLMTQTIYEITTRIEREMQQIEKRIRALETSATERSKSRSDKIVVVDSTARRRE